MKVKSLALALGLAFGAVAAQAAPISLNPGPLFLQFSNLEQAGPINTSGFSNLNLGGTGANDLTTGASEFNWGVFNVSTIQLGAVATPNTDIGGGTPYFTNGGVGGAQVSGIFYGFQLSTTLTLTGGWIDLYWNDAGTISESDIAGNTYSPTARTDWNQAGKFTSGTLLARLQYASGIIDGDSVTTVSSTLDPLTLSRLGNGLADGFANVVDINGDGKIDDLDGAWAAAINTDWFNVDPDGDGKIGETGETRDLRFSTFYSNLDSWDGAPGSGLQGLRSNDPARGFVVPEPGILALMGIAMAGLGITRRRRSA